VRDEGLVRWLDLTGHSHDAPTTIQTALDRVVHSDAVMIPLNFWLC
jgi:hypothetical protein